MAEQVELRHDTAVQTQWRIGTRVDRLQWHAGVCRRDKREGDSHAQKTRREEHDLLKKGTGVFSVEL